jgi:sucrose-6F-phosphate phosphohydrolase
MTKRNPIKFAGDELDEQKKIKLFSTDLDGTFLDEMDLMTQFYKLWSSLQDDQPLLCYNSGRLVHDVKQLVSAHLLPEPDYIIGGVGTAIYDFKNQKTLKEFSEILEDGWDNSIVENTLAELDLDLTKQPDHYQNDYKSSWFLHDATPDMLRNIEHQLKSNSMQCHVVYSSGMHLDILPKWANKGNALSWLLDHLGIHSSETIVAGDTGNDTAMFLLDGVKGIVVGNAQLELRDVTRDIDSYIAPEDEKAMRAIIRGLHYWGVFPSIEMSTPENWEKSDLYAAIKYGDEDILQKINAAELGTIRLGYENAVQALYKCMSDLGFLACSPDDNDSKITDENYNSVWARDGAITILGSLPLTLKDEKIRSCQKQTLRTLLDHTSPNGQIPSNVRLASRMPDYSGVGGISSIDSGLWIIIAFYAYVHKTQDFEFLRERFHTIQQVMNWLSAHDSNNDGLIEIPEAGDWTDLFGRSYNVLYDEVLWHRANVCFGRLLQMLGDEQRAGDYLRWARIIKRQIQTYFWPSTEKPAGHPALSFADKQNFLGDARYLIAQVTPFDFSWRCDTFGNVLAFLFDVIDDRFAAQSFRFMWGVGVNEPYPIANLYPVVTAGDKEWRDYYTVNLLNLPAHYHNGGIWPFVGAHWVRFINKLGMSDIALQEMYRLANLCKLGITNEWEFNEWMHGHTGRPMGKAYQAWSAAQYILTCHDLDIIKG